MAIWYGMIGYGETVETEPSVYSDTIVEKPYYGMITRDTRRFQSSDKVNDDLVISNQLSIISDPYAMENFQNMRYATYMGTKWKITEVEVQYPRLIISLGSEYNAH